MMATVNELTWPLSRVDEGIERLARMSGLLRGGERHGDGDRRLRTTDREPDLQPLCASLGLDTEAVHAPLCAVGEALRASAPAVWRVADTDGGVRYLLLAAVRRGVRVLAPDGALRRVPHSDLVGLVTQATTLDVEPAIDDLLGRMRLSARRARRARAALRDELLEDRLQSGGWILRARTSAPWWRLAREAGLVRRVAALVVLQLASLAVFLGSWYLLGRAILTGSMHPSWFVGWALLLLTSIPLQMGNAWMQGTVAVRAGALVKRKLLRGALHYDLDRAKRTGSGQLLGRAFESEAFESLALNAGFLGVTSVLETVAACLILTAGAGGLPHASILVGFVAITVTVAVWRMRRERSWTRERVAISDELVENILGHRTRLAQQERSSWHCAEDDRLERYLQATHDLDRTSVAQVAVPSLWLAAGLAGLAPALVAGASPGALAASVGGLLLAKSALAKLSRGLAHLGSCRIAWETVQSLFAGARHEAPLGDPRLGRSAGDENAGSAAEVGTDTDIHASTPPLLEADGLTYRYEGSERPAIVDCELRVRRGDRILIHGDSGGGKSTLVSMLGGLRRPSSGLLLLRGLDPATWGDAAWRRRVAVVPQFKENHVYSSTLAFNLLLGRAWPPGPGDMALAYAVCRELGLGELLGRMPAGLHEVVGETGWRLSHGERSRMFLARALLQDADVVVLDESLAALDATSAARAVACALKRSRSLVVVAHP